MALVAATTAAAVAAGMYIDAKTGIKADASALIGLKKGERAWAQAVKDKRTSLYYLWEEAALRRKNDECIWSREGCYTWMQAYDRVNQWAQWYIKQGVKSGDLVAFYLQNSPDFMFAWFGLWAIGAAPAMINYNLGGKALVHCLKISGARIMIVDADPELQGRIAEVQVEVDADFGMQSYVFDEGMRRDILEMPALKPGDEWRVNVKGSDPMSLLYTSGTTGLPKGCAFNIDRMYLVCCARATGTALTTEEDRWYDCMPFYHGTGGCSAVTQLTTGVTLCVGKKFSTSQFWNDCRDSRATWITYVGETARYLLANPPSALDKQHHVRNMFGNGLRPDVWTKFRDRFGIEQIVEFFNSTEGVFSLVTVAKGDYLAASVGRHGLLLRTVLKNTYVPVKVDPVTGDIWRDPKTGFAQREPYEVGGEIIVAIPNPQAFQGYHNNPEATKKKFASNVFKKGDLYYRSGDALRRTEDGRWFFLDRLGDTFRWKGENVSTAEVSEVIGNYPGVVEANVYGVELPNHDGRAGCAAVYIDPAMRKNFNFEDLLKYTRAKLPKYAVPLFLRVVEEMTPIHNNKQNKVPLREEGVDPAKKKNQNDEMWWVHPDKDKSHTYHPFTEDHWADLHLGKARL